MVVLIFVVVFDCLWVFTRFAEFVWFVLYAVCFRCFACLICVALYCGFWFDCAGDLCCLRVLFCWVLCCFAVVCFSGCFVLFVVLQCDLCCYDYLVLIIWVWFGDASVLCLDLFVFMFRCLLLRFRCFVQFWLVVLGLGCL